MQKNCCGNTSIEWRIITDQQGKISSRCITILLFFERFEMKIGLCALPGQCGSFQCMVCTIIIILQYYVNDFNLVIHCQDGKLQYPYMCNEIRKEFKIGILWIWFYTRHARLKGPIQTSNFSLGLMVDSDVEPVLSQI